MNDLSRGRRLMIRGAAVAGPVVAAMIVRVLLSAGPAASSAAMADPLAPATDGAVASRKLTDKQAAAIEYIGMMGGLRDTPSPLDHPQPVSVQVEAMPTGEMGPTQRMPPELEFRGVMGAEGNAVARIGQTVYHVGDTVAEGWTLTDIDTRWQTIEVSSDDGQVLLVKLRE